MNDFDWIGLVVVLFFLLFPLLSTFLKKKQSVQKKVSPRPIHFPSSPEIKRQVINPPSIPPSQKKEQPRSSPRKKFVTKYGSIKNGIILSEILKRPYLD